ncbi:CHAD domain-containing protein [Pedobacter immunditicola]|uniref:CHAD domain-containing protein n=1 Tax=Pedobacter immunditicola TaxID=3133440 RepID=UPI00309F4386
MKAGAEIRLLEKNWKQLKPALKSYLKTENPEQLHQFRVQVKKIKSLLVLYTINKKNKKLLKLFGPVKKIFRHAGIIRDSYIHLQLADQFQVKEPAFHKAQTDLMFKEMGRFKKNGKKYEMILEKTLLKIKGELSSIGNSEIADFYEAELDRVVLAFAKREFNDHMHDCRKRLKNLLYNQKIADKSMKGKLKLNLPYLDQVQDQLGQWHDSMLARDLFKDQMKEERQAVDKLNLQLKNLEEGLVSISADFWQKAVLKNNGQSN